MAAAQEAVNWWAILVPVAISVGGGTIVGNILVALFKARLDKNFAVAQRERDRHLARAEILRRLIAAIVGARSAASDARHTDLNKKSNLEEVASRSKNIHERHVDNFERLADEALVEAERYGLLPEWTALPDRRLSAYVEFVLNGRLGFTLDADSYKWGESSDAHQHASALISDLRTLVEAEEALAQDVFIGRDKRKTFRVPELPYLNMLKVYYPAREINVRGLDTSVLENRIAQEEHEQAERQKRLEASRAKALKN